MAAIAYRPRFFTPSWMIRLAWTYSLVQFLPTLYFADVKSITFDDNQTVCYCTTVRNNTSPGIAYLISLSMPSFVLPLLTMSILYYKVARVVWRRQQNISVSSTTSSNTATLKLLIQTQKRVTLVLLIVVLVLICWAPFVIYCGILERNLRGFPNPMDGVTLALYGPGLANSMTNPFIDFFNTGGKRANTIRDLYLEISGKKEKQCKGRRV